MTAVCVFLVVTLVASILGDPGPGEPWVVQIDQGAVRGYKAEGNSYFTFFGVPYATAPSGAQKFKAPLPAPKWTEILDATNRYISCPQNQMMAAGFSDRHHSIVTENCLYANIYVPESKKPNLPVVVYVHGGAFQVGFGELASHTPLVKTGKVLVVNFNYRVGAYGFLCLGTEDVPGNAGMKDQVAALRWVRDNIAKFGGNPNDVTIAGYSAGSASVDLLMLSKAARGLFNKVIPESGAAVGVWSVQLDPIQTAKEFAWSQNFQNSDDLQALENFYKTTSLDVLLSDPFLSYKNSTFKFEPCVEAKTSEESFLDDTPLNILKKGDFNKVPLLIGFAESEGMFRLPLLDEWKDEMNKNFADFLPADLGFSHNNEKVKVAKEVKEFYFGNKEINEDTVQAFVNYFTDVLFAYATMKSVRLNLEAGGKSIYLYEYSYYDDSIPSQHNFKGANHCAQSGALFESSFFPNSNTTTEYEGLKKTMVELWTNFITTGKPVHDTSSLFPSGWPEITLKSASYMNLNVKPELKYDLLKERTEFWDKIYDKYYRQPIPPKSYLHSKTEL